MKTLARITVLLACLAGVAHAEPAALPSDVLQLPLTAQERQFLLQMCEAAAWANRMVYAPACEQLKAKFEEARRPLIATPPK